MTPNSENAMARFLLAILNQKNLKDIDWNQVANDPVLLQPITNGHAARMRFARFRSTVNGHEPQKRNRTGDKSRVSKPKKAPQHKRGEAIVKSESGAASLSPYAQVRQASPNIKLEQTAYLAQFSPASTSSPYLTDDMDPRFLTPCSDDMAQGISVNPRVLEDLRLRNGFGPSMGDFMPPPPASGHDHLGLAQSPLHTFDAAYDLSSYKAGDAHSPSVFDLNGAPSLADGTGNEWSDQFIDPHF